MTRSWFLRRALLALSLSGAVSACAAIWGFQDAIDLPDSGPGASTDASGLGNGDSTSGSLDSTVGDAGDALAAIADAANDVSEDAPQPDLCAACAPPRPGTGWSAPFELFQLDALLAADGAAPGAPPPLPSCGQANPAWAAALDLHGLPDAAPAACTCSCGAPSGSLCSAVATYFVDSECRTACGTPMMIDAGCTALAPSDPLCTRAQLAATLVDAGTCAPAAVSIVVPPVSWQVTARLCSPSTVDTSASSAQGGGACEAGVCVPATESGFENAYCTIYADIVDCPDAGYPVRHGYNDAGSAYYAGVVDTRACSPCGCDSPANVVCTLEGGTTNTTSAAGACVQPSSSDCANINMGPMTTFATATATPVGGACATLPEGGEPTGTLMPTAPYTICCTQ
jgi:hypothetical protein